MSDIRESILNFLDELPPALEDAEEMKEIFGDAPELHRSSTKLYIAVLSVLGRIVQECHKSHTRESTR